MTDTGARVCALTTIVAGLAMGVISLEEKDGVLLDEEDHEMLDIAIKMELAMKRLARYKANPLQFLFDFLNVQNSAFGEGDNPFQAVHTWLDAELQGIVLDFHIN